MKTRHLTMAIAATALVSAAPASFAEAVFKITETYVGVSGEDGTADWIEVTNLGTSTGSTDGFFYDDESADAADAGALDAFSLAPGESAIFLVADDLADAIEDDVNFTDPFAEFASIWGSGISVGLTNGGGGLSQNGDSAFIGTVVGGAIFNIVDGLVYDASDLPSSGLATLEQVLGNGPTESIAGINGAYTSNAFFNDNIGGVGNSISLVGSPGVAPIPVPAMLPAFAAALGGLGLRARRRA